MNEVIIHLRIALLCSFPLKFIIRSCLHPFLSTPLVEDELTVCVSGRHKNLPGEWLPLSCVLSSPIWAKPADLWGLLLFSRTSSLSGLRFWAGGVLSGVLDTSLRTGVLSVCLWCCKQNILSLVWKRRSVAEYWWQQEQCQAFFHLT